MPTLGIGSKRRGRMPVAGNTRSMRKRCVKTRNQAFTLVELMVVIALIGILSAMILPAMRGTYGDALLRSSSRELVNVFSLAYSRAVSINQVHRVRFEKSSGRYVIERCVREAAQGDEFAPVKDVAGCEGELDQRISLQIHETDSEVPPDGEREAPPPPDKPPGNQLESQTISFYPDGTADSVMVLLQDREGFRLGLKIDPVTARVRITALPHE